MLIDNHGRKISYLRLSVTDHCNLRCLYCMPAEGIHFAQKSGLLTWEELVLLAKTFVELGINKIRITGGEPFVRKGMVPFLVKLAQLPGLENISITTNATLIGNHLHTLKDCNINQINVSLDSLDKERFFHITRRDCFETVLDNIYRMLDLGFKVKLNCVVMDNKNIDDIVPLIQFANKHRLTVRFLEEMPFNGQSVGGKTLKWDYGKILDHITSFFPQFEQLPGAKAATATNYRIKGTQGIFGIIPSFSRTFCGSCNRVRVSAKGEMQTCLYAAEATNLKAGIGNAKALQLVIRQAMQKRHRTGFEAEKNAITKKSMALLGG